MINVLNSTFNTNIKIMHTIIKRQTLMVPSVELSLYPTFEKYGQQFYFKDIKTILLRIRTPESLYLLPFLAFFFSLINGKLLCSDDNIS